MEGSKSTAFFSKREKMQMEGRSFKTGAPIDRSPVFPTMPILLNPVAAESPRTVAARHSFILKLIDPSVNLAMAIPHPQFHDTVIVTSALARLLQERGVGQKRLSEMTGVSERGISRIRNRRVVRRIDCVAAVKICLALSLLPRCRDGRTEAIRLDRLFPMVSAAE